VIAGLHERLLAPKPVVSVKRFDLILAIKSYLREVRSLAFHSQSE